MIDSPRALRPTTWSLLALIATGITLFGAVGSTPLPGDLGRVDLYLYFLVLATLLSSALIWLTPRERRPPTPWVLAALAFPLWVALQLLPLPRALRTLISPESVDQLARAWPGELIGCGGDLLLNTTPPALWPLSLDPLSTMRFLLLPIAAAAVLLGIYSALRAGAISRRALLTAIALFAGAEALYGLLQWALDLGFALWRPIEHENASGTLINRNHFAMLLYLGLACSIAMLDRCTRSARSFDARTNLRVAGFSLLAGMQIAGVLASQSRGGLLGILLVLVAGVPAILRQRSGYRSMSLALLALICVPAAIALFPDLSERFAAIGSEWDSPNGRGAVYLPTAEIIRDYPLTGIGAGAFALVFAGVRSPLVQVRWEHVHNDWLEAWVETGTPGLLILVVLAGAILVAGFRGRRRSRPRLPYPLLAGLLAVLLHALADFSLQVPALALMAAAFAALIITWPEVQRSRCLPPRSPELSSPGSLLLAFAALALAVPAWSDPSMRPPQRPDACAELREIAATLAARPLDSWASARLARLSSGTGAPSALAAVPPATIRSLSDHVRRTDPWNAQKRARTLALTLEFGDTEAALGDLVALARTNPKLLVTRRRVFDRLYALGVTRSQLAERLRTVTAESKEAMRQIVRDASFREDYELVRALVPPEPDATPAACMASSAIRLALQRAYGTTEAYELFLVACLSLPEIRQSAEDHQRILTWLAGEYLRQRRPDDAKPLIDGIENDNTRAGYLRRWGRHTKNWPTVRNATWLQLENLSPKASANRYRAALHWELAVAYSHLGDQPAARTHAQHAADLDPARADAITRITRLQRSLLDHPATAAGL